jgi:hypothetical protein
MIFGLLGISLSIVIWLVEHRESTDRRLIVSAMSFVLFFMALIPILSLYFYYITPYANDRYSYVASPFFFLGFILLLYRLSANWRYSVLILYLILNMFHSRNMIKSAVLAGQGLDYSLQNLPCDKLNDKDVFLLGLADNFQGNYYYRSFSDDGDTFVKSMKLFYPERSCEARSWHNPAQYNLNYATEGLKAHFVDAQTIKVFIAQNGTWFMRNGIGLANYENDIYSVELHGWYYLLKLKENFDNAIFLVPSGAEWSELKRPVAEEIN